MSEVPDQAGPSGSGPAGPPGSGPVGPLDWRPELRTLAEVGSTNRYLLDEARRGAPPGLAVAAEHQTAGRGRLGRSWESVPGTSVQLSVLLRPVLAPEDLHLCSLLVALAALATCRERAGVTASLKWPNDLVVGDRKLAGVLAEADPSSPGGRPGSTAVVVGIGLNVSWPGPSGAGGTCLADEVGGAGGLGKDDRGAEPAGACPEPAGSAPGPAPPSVAELRVALLAEVGRRVPTLESPAGRAALIDELAARCSTLGRDVRVTLAGEVVEGRVEAITAAGHLVVRTAGSQRRTIAAGDVVHLRPADPADPADPSGRPRPAN